MSEQSYSVDISELLKAAGLVLVQDYGRREPTAHVALVKDSSNFYIAQAYPSHFANEALWQTWQKRIKPDSLIQITETSRGLLVLEPYTGGSLLIDLLIDEKQQLEPKQLSALCLSWERFIDSLVARQQEFSESFNLLLACIEYQVDRQGRYHFSLRPQPAPPWLAQWNQASALHQYVKPGLDFTAGAHWCRDRVLRRLCGGSVFASRPYFLADSDQQDLFNELQLRIDQPGREQSQSLALLQQKARQKRMQRLRRRLLRVAGSFLLLMMPLLFLIRCNGDAITYWQGDFYRSLPEQQLELDQKAALDLSQHKIQLGKLQEKLEFHSRLGEFRHAEKILLQLKKLDLEARTLKDLQEQLKKQLQRHYRQSLEELGRARLLGNEQREKTILDFLMANYPKDSPEYLSIKVRFKVP